MAQALYSVPGQAGGNKGKRKRQQHRGGGLDAAVAVGVLTVSGLAALARGNDHQDIRSEVRERMNAISHQCL